MAERALWECLPVEYRESAFCYTDFWRAYALVIPSEQHEAAGKKSGWTSYGERFNLTARQRISRLVSTTRAPNIRLHPFPFRRPI